ncbi:uncharacterized protein LOC143882253 isoform X2 [Tasmannia lanceolata]|uniref:uncharacterized protein LOC143882253 isoform X2 n=1 Tax=Tasmannia lanceolata TaxID=3420 RepID=UPI0040631F2C
MASLIATSSPNSFQLRLGFKSKKSSFVLLRMNFRNLDYRRISVCSASGSAARDEGESWMNSDASDSFSGWFDKDSGNGLSPKRGFGGIVGVGLAGVFLAAGVAFASLSFSKRSTAGPKLQMEPLTIQQEVLPATEDWDENVDQLEKEGNTVLLDEGNQQNGCDSKCNTGINLDSFSPIETSEATSENIPCDKINVRTSLLQNVAIDSNGFDAIPHASGQEDLQIHPGVDDITEPSASNPRPPELSESDVVQDSHSITIFDLPVPEAIIEIKTNLPSDSLTSGCVVTSESDIMLDSQVHSKDVVETLTPVSSQQEFNPSEKLQLLSEGISSPPERHNLNETEPFGATSESVLADLYGNESDMNGHNEINRSSLFDSPIPESSFSYAGIPAPSLVSAALQVPPGKVVVPAIVDQVQGQAFAALQVLKVIEPDVQPSDLCTRREYARWLLCASSVLSRSTISKVYPAMFIENVTELAFDDVTPEDPDFPFIQGLAEAGLISSKLSINDAHHSQDKEHNPILFSPESPLSRQDLISWKMALEKRQLPDADRKILYQCSGFIDIDKINPDAWPALVADLSAGEHGITALAFGYTRLFQPDKPVTKAQAAIALATGDATEVVGEELTRIEAESIAETAVAAHTALVAQVEKDLNASFEKELLIEREKIDAIEKLAEEARLELERLRAESEEENDALMRGRAAVESEMEVLSRLRVEVEEQLQSLMSNKMEISFERDRINKLRKEAENENQVIAQLQYDLEVERKALSMARTWAEDEAKRAREQAKALEEARERWERHGLKIVVDEELRDYAYAGVTWVEAGKPSPIDGTVNRAEKLVVKLKAMSSEIKGKSFSMAGEIKEKSASMAGEIKEKSTAMAGEIKGRSFSIIEKIIQKIEYLISVMKQQVAEAARQARDLQSTIALKASRSAEEFQENAINFGSNVKDGAKRIAEDCREGVEKITQKFKT